MKLTLSARRAIFAAVALLPLAAGAQTKAEDPQDPQAATAGAPYKSAFADYKSYQDPELQSWKKSNADVARPDTMAGNSSAVPAPPAGPHAMPGHDGMQKH
ncbi:MAG: hypothetical protein JWQ61_3792 [Collimonas fungivorans]|uniref:hypothetical protein n=1 Tax=Collimonas fungivorans TaxID=158899 RepID=UPI0026F2BE8E|nr:hypothetical protein [Collimonas fungivorans]MDB5768978.1 hypothetical protein [Collimonas fungivorans]